MQQKCGQPHPRWEKRQRERKETVRPPAPGPPMFITGSLRNFPVWRSTFHGFHSIHSFTDGYGDQSLRKSRTCVKGMIVPVACLLQSLWLAASPFCGPSAFCLGVGGIPPSVLHYSQTLSPHRVRTKSLTDGSYGFLLLSSSS